MLWRIDRIQFLSACFENTSAQKTIAGRFVEHKLSSATQSFDALGIFVSFFDRPPHCRNPPGSVNRTFLIFRFTEEMTMLYNMEDCGHRIAKLRVQHGYTQERLADALNMDRSLLSRAEAGKRGLSIEIYVQLSALFDVSLDYLLIGKMKTPDEMRLKKNIETLIEHLEEFKGNL